MYLFNDLAGDAAFKAALGILLFSRGQVRMIKIFNDQCMLMLSYHITDNCQVASLWTGWIWCFCTVYYGLINAVNDNGSPARRLQYYLYLSPCHHPFINPLKASRLSSGAISPQHDNSLTPRWKALHRERMEPSPHSGAWALLSWLPLPSFSLHFEPPPTSARGWRAIYHPQGTPWQSFFFFFLFFCNPPQRRKHSIWRVLVSRALGRGG